jgi:acetyl-CoA carboxylase biotin carboxyl carrier protein
MKQQDIDDLKQLIEFLKKYQVAEFDLDRGDLKIRLKFNQPEASPAKTSDLSRLLASVPQAAVATSTPAPAAPAPAVPQADDGLHVIKSPLVGTFYSAPAQDSDPFVTPGTHVTKGQVVGIVEAMKLMNEIESDVAGEIVKCLVTNGQPIEYGQPLFSIRAD